MGICQHHSNLYKPAVADEVKRAIDISTRDKANVTMLIISLKSRLTALASV